MPFYEKRSVHIYYEEVGSGFPLLLIPGGKERILLAMRPHTHLPPGASTVTAVGSSTSATLRAMPSDSAP